MALAEETSADLQVLQKGRWGHCGSLQAAAAPATLVTGVSHPARGEYGEQEPTAEQLAQIAAENGEDENAGQL